ncbi:hypothetical protein QR680_011279 [Steinernema hermaphroditum]|uniref:Uncharacterized protein n=1 Tax=Steinernema hermaphroditum TaxID=289476 RepID=A0AA39MD30_9BILA|nr:hypothetical protein QR680_011279 [Steinernema hermaphroditum]
MDTVPFEFCQDVMERVSWCQPKFDEDASYMPEPWKTVAAKQKLFDVVFLIESGEWYYCIGYIKGVTTFEELLEMDRRYVKCIAISTGLSVNEFLYTKVKCSKEEIKKKLVPLMMRQARPNCHFFTVGGIRPWLMDNAKEESVAFIDMFQNVFTFGEITLPYWGSNSFEFLANQIKHNVVLKRLSCSGQWPNSDAVQDLILKFLDSPDDRQLSIGTLTRDYDPQRDLKVNMRIFKAALDSWLASWSPKTLIVDGPIGLTKEEILSLPVPDNVTRTETFAKNHDETTVVIKWRKEDESSIGLQMIYSTGCIYIDTNPGIFDPILPQPNDSDEYDSSRYDSDSANTDV